VIELADAGGVPIAAKRRHGHVSREILRKITDALARHGVELPRNRERSYGGLLYFVASFIGLATFVSLNGVFLSFTVITLMRFLLSF
jgi:hypothetical protein